MNRQIRRQQEKDKLKQLQQKTPQQSTTSPTLEKQLNDVLGNIFKKFGVVEEHLKVLRNNIWLLSETLIRKKVISLQDIKDTETLYLEREKKRLDKIKELLASDKTTYELLEEIVESNDLPVYERFSINPVTELNLNPFEVGSILKEKFPGLKDEEYLQIGKKWGLNNTHFGIKEKEKEIV